MQGLSEQEVKKLREEHGLNEIHSSQGISLISMFLNQFKDTLIIILCVAAVISFFHSPTESIVIAVIILLNAVVGFIQEYRTEQTIAALNTMINPTTQVRRDGKEYTIETKYLVPGDIVILREGDKVPADGILVESHNVSVEESALTGESVPVDKKKDDEVYMGTSLVRGSAVIQITAIGSKTTFGEIAVLATETKQTMSPIQKELTSIGMFVAKMAAAISIFLLLIHVLQNSGSGESFYAIVAEGVVFAVSVAVAAVPEGLPTTITVALALGASVLAKNNAVIKKLSSVETLGTVSTICTDKTGTLTKNEMTVEQLISSSGNKLSFTGVGYNPDDGEVVDDNSHNDEITRIADIAHYCNEAKLTKNDQGSYDTLGDPTEIALLTMAQKVYTHQHNDTERYTREDIFPFDSERKLMSVVVRNSNEELYVFVKGSPDHVLDYCDSYWNGTEVVPLTPSVRASINHHYDNMAQSALRVLATAYKHVNEHPQSMDEAESQLIYTGLIGMIDPPRDEIKASIQQTKKAGIRTIVITGDYGITASVIAEKLGIIETSSDVVINGNELDRISDTDLQSMLADTPGNMVFARTLPVQKMRIVDALQHNGERVAMTGDGVNDAPALKRADVGVAMGITGTDVSKESATMVLLDDSFATIVDAIKEGRRIYDNLKKFVLYTLSSNVGEIVVIVLSVLSGTPLILTAVLILTINLGTDILPAIALGVEPAESGLMERKPRDPRHRVLNKTFIKRLVTIGITIGVTVIAAFMFTLMHEGWQWGNEISSELLVRGQTLAFATLVIAQLFNSFSVKSQKPLIWRHIYANTFHQVAILISLAIVLIVVYVPFLNRVLGTVPLYSQDWIVIFIASVIPVLIFEIIKYMKQK